MNMTEKQYALLIDMNQVLSPALDITHPRWRGWDWKYASEFIEKNYRRFVKAKKQAKKNGQQIQTHSDVNYKHLTPNQQALIEAMIAWLPAEPATPIVKDMTMAQASVFIKKHQKAYDAIQEDLDADDFGVLPGHSSQGE